MKKTYMLFMAIILGLTTCTKPYEHEITEFEDILVVQGLLTNDVGPYSVYLSKTVSLSSDTVNYVEDAIVTIIDQLGNVILLTEIDPGHYITDPSFQTQVNNEYQLSIETADNRKYISDPVILKKGPAIDSVYTVYKEEYDFDNNVYLKGIEIRINSEKWNQDDNNMYFKWDYEETWELEQKWEGFEFDFGDWSQLVEYRGGLSEKSCWDTDYSTDIILDKTANFSIDQIVGKQLIYLSEQNHKPYFGYSILVKQFIINKAVYEFWTFLKENNIENGSVFDNIPYNAKSNIECVNDDVNVYGYFDAAYRSEKRLNLISPILGVEFENYNNRCESYQMSFSDFKKTAFGSIPIYALNIDSMGGFISFTHQLFCLDCSVICTSEEEPPFWIFK